MIWTMAVAMAAAAPLLYLEPASYQVSAGERVSVVFRTDGAPAFAPEQLRNAAVYTDGAAFNITSLRIDEARVVGNAPIRATGTLVMAVAATRDGCTASAKALVVSGASTANAARRLNHPLEIVAVGDPHTSKEARFAVLANGQPAAGVEPRVQQRGALRVVEARSGCHTATLIYQLP